MKSDPKILAQMMLQGAMPLMAQMLSESEPYQHVVQTAAKGKDVIRSQFSELRERLDQIETAVIDNYDRALAQLGDVLSEAGLEAVVEQARRDISDQPVAPADPAQSGSEG